MKEDHLAEQLEKAADAVAQRAPALSLVVLEQLLREAAEAIRSPDSGARVEEVDDRLSDEARSRALDKLNEITRAGFGDWYIGLAEMDAIETAMLALDALEPAPPTLKGEDDDEAG